MITSLVVDFKLANEHIAVIIFAGFTQAKPDIVISVLDALT